MDIWARVVITTSVETLDWSWIYCYTNCILGRAPQTKETLPNFCENMHPDKWDTIVWYRVTRNPQEFRRLTSCQRDPWDMGRHILMFAISLCGRLLVKDESYFRRLRLSRISHIY